MARARLKTVLSIIIATALIAWVFSEIDARLTWSWVQRADRTQLLGALLLLVAAYAARAGRWLVWQPTLGYGASAKAVLVGFMGKLYVFAGTCHYEIDPATFASTTLACGP